MILFSYTEPLKTLLLFSVEDPLFAHKGHKICNFFAKFPSYFSCCFVYSATQSKMSRKIFDFLNDDYYLSLPSFSLLFVT